MNAKMKRRHRHDRLKRIRTEHRENMLFFARGTIPASSRSFATCSCGSRAFSRVGGGDLDDFYDAHVYCDYDTE